MKFRNTLEKFGCTETVHETPDIECFCAEVWDDLFGSTAAQQVQDMLSEGHEFDDDEVPDEEIAHRLKQEFIRNIEIL